MLLFLMTGVYLARMIGILPMSLATKLGDFMASHVLLDALLPRFLGIGKALLFYLSRYVFAIVIGALFILKTMTIPFLSYHKMVTDFLTRADGRVTVSGSDWKAAVYAR